MDQRAELEKKKALIGRALSTGSIIPGPFWTYLEESEQQLIQLMTSPTPPPPGAPGNIEFGWVLYYLNQHSKSFPWNLITIPATKITTAEWNAWWTIWEAQGVLLGDGSLVSTAKYAVMDEGWSIALLEYIVCLLDLNSTTPFASSSNVVPLDLSSMPSLKVALFGDWGTGSYTDGNLPNSPSQLVLQQMIAQLPDVMIHLGDVYYAGDTISEQNNLVTPWSAAKPTSYNFTMNSNHEMYDGANGIYATALSNTGLFQKQQGLTYFSVIYNNWVIIGLDSAYNAEDFYMNGRITDAFQPAFLAAQAQGKKLLLLTHHNPVDVLGATPNKLWSDVVTALNGRYPDVWYWGHIHNGIVYSPDSACGMLGTKGRCLGHASIPFGNAEWLEQAQLQPGSGVEFYAHTPLGDSAPNNALRVKNGFAVLEFSANGDLLESWYDQDGGQPVWQNMIRSTTERD